MSAPTTTLLTSVRPPVLARMWHDEPRHTGMALVLLACAVPIALASELDPRLMDGVSVWAKPLKFQLALALYCLTLAFVARWVPQAMRAERRWRLFTWAVVGCVAAEALWIGAAASFGLRSHFNRTELPLMLIYPLMGVLATILTAGAAQHAWGIHRNERTGLAAGTKAGLVWGLGLTLPLTLLTAFTLASGTDHHVQPGSWLGAAGPDAGGAPFFNWSREHGDGRMPHFLATHSMHVVPLAALALSALGWRSAWAGRTIALAWSAIVLMAFAATLSGRSLVGWLGP